MVKRFGRLFALKSYIAPLLFYGSLATLIIYWEWPYVKEVKHGVLITIGLFVAWRYGWMVLNYLRAFIYATYYYPHLQRQIRTIPLQKRYPDHIYFLIPSYKEEPWISAETFRSIMSELQTVPSHATLIVSTSGDPAEEDIIYQTCRAHLAFKKCELVFQKQSHGKRIAMGHGLRAIARRFHKKPGESSVTVMMDGDSYLEKGFLQKTLPHFSIDPSLGALTTNETAYIKSRSGWYRDWFALKFGQRHILFQSHALSGKVLTLTGRLSIYRTNLIVEEGFISRIENDTITSPLHGKFRFLMGDDKSTWYHLLAQGTRMIYVPDAVCYSLESRDGGFFEISRSLSYRWYGNTLRNSMRALALGPQRIGSLFIWWAVLDQRISMWTSLVGITGAVTLALFQSFHYLIFYIGWITYIRLFQMGVITLGGHPVSWRTLPLMLYSQWIGALVKIKALYHLNDQKWSKGKTVQHAQDAIAPIRHPLFAFMPDMMMVTSFIFFIYIILLTHHAVSLPHLPFFSPLYADAKRPTHIDALRYGIIPNDHRDDAPALQKLIQNAPDNAVIHLPAGTLDLYSPLVIRRSHITLEGAGKEKTRLLSHLTTQAQAVISIEGKRLHRIGTLLKSTQTGDTVIEANLTQAPLSPWLLLRQPNDDAFLSQLGSRRWHKRYPYLRQEIVPYVQKREHHILLGQQLLTPLQKQKSEIFTLLPVTHVTLRKFTVIQAIPHHRIEEAQCRYENLFPNYRVDLIRLQWTAHCKIKELVLLHAGRHALNLDGNYGIEVKDITVDGAWNKGKKGNGYIKIARTFHSIFENITANRIRHLTIQWSSAGNLLSRLHLGVDINFHGGYSHDNTVTDVTFHIPPCHRWQKGITTTPPDAQWAPPDGPRNRVESVRFQ